MSAEQSNGLRRYMPLWLFLGAQFVIFVIWCATLQQRVNSMQHVGGVPISTEARERLSAAETTLRNHEVRIIGLEDRERE